MVDVVDSNGLPAWSERVRFSERDGVAYHPHEVLVVQSAEEVANRVLGIGNVRTESGNFFRYGSVESPLRVRGEIADPRRAADELRMEGAFAQVNHVLFSHSDCSCCGPHPFFLFADPSWAGPLAANPFHANPFHANPFHANPFHANPLHANPFHANPFHANPFHANPFHANFAPSPLLLLSSGAPEVAAYRATGVRSTSAEPASAPPGAPAPGAAATVRNDPSIVVVDTGIAIANLRPHALAGLAADNTDPNDVETPDETPFDGKLDSDAGHGTFIAGVIEGIVPGCKLRVDGLLTGQGDMNEADLAKTLEDLATQDGGRPDLVNLSFGGYTVDGMERLRQAVRTLQDAGTVIVASAGNDATCVPAYPAAFPDVVSVGAIGPFGPAPFTNYGSWVRACAPGIDIVSTFFTACATDDGAAYGEWVRWSGTSFAAPAVVGVLAEMMKQGMSGAEAVRRTIDAPGLLRIPDLGTVVNRQPWY